MTPRRRGGRRRRRSRRRRRLRGTLAAAEAKAEKAERERDAAVSEATEARLVREEAEREAYVNKENALKLAESNLRIDSEGVRCKRMFAEARGLRDSEVARATQKGGRGEGSSSRGCQ